MAKKYYKYEQAHRIANGVKQKLCPQCKNWKDESRFCTSRKSTDGLQWRCRDCESKYARKRYERIRKSAIRYLRYEDCHRLVNRVKEKLCRKCRKWKRENEFYKDTSGKDSLMSRCKKCTYKPAKKSHKKRRPAVKG